MKLKFKTALTSGMPLSSLAETLHEFSKQYPMAVVITFENNYIVSYQGRVSSTSISDSTNKVIAMASILSVWAIQNPNKLFEALTTAITQS